MVHCRETYWLIFLYSGGDSTKRRNVYNTNIYLLSKITSDLVLICNVDKVNNRKIVENRKNKLEAIEINGNYFAP